MDAVVPMLLLATLLACTWYLVWWAVGRQARTARRQDKDGREGGARQSGVSRPGGDKASVAFFATMTVLVGVLVWIGVSGHHLPDWLLWATTVL